MSYSQVVDLMNSLLGAHYHAENTYKKGITRVDDKVLKSFFVTKAAEKGSMINELTDIILRLNGTPLKEGSSNQKAAVIWTEVLMFFNGNNKGAILNECKKAEQTVLDEYKEVLKHATITDFNRSILEGHRDEISEGLLSSYEI